MTTTDTDAGPKRLAPGYRAGVPGMAALFTSLFLGGTQPLGEAEITAAGELPGGGLVLTVGYGDFLSGTCGVRP